MASVLDITGKACAYLGIEAPEALAASTDRTAVELAAVVQDAAEYIADQHDWQALKVLNTYTGTGAATAFDLPSDFLRMPKDTNIWSSAQETPMTHVLSHDDWLELEVKSYELVIRAWTIIGDQVAIKPTMPATETAKFYYQSTKIFNDGSSNIAEFTADTDTFRLGDRLLRWGIIWMFKATKGLDYAEDLATFEIVLAKRIAEDKGARTIAVGRGRYPRGVDIAYPQAITP